MLQRRFAILCLSLMLAGCMPQPCGGADYGRSNEEYAATYTGTYTKLSGTGENLVLNLVLSDSGSITGTVSEPATSRQAQASGRVTDWFHPCGSDETLIEVRFTFSGEPESTISGGRAQGRTEPWRFNCTYTKAQPIGSGDVVLSRQ